MPPEKDDQMPTPVPKSDPISPDLLAWLRQTLDEQEVLREIREVEETGGCKFESFIDEVVARATRP